MTFPHLRPAAGLFALFAASLLSACAPMHVALHPEGGGADAAGVVRTRLIEPYPIEVTIDGLAYAGNWRTQPAPDHPLAQSYLHKRHVGRVLATLTSSDGRRLNCNWLVHGFQGKGTCEDDSHKKFDVSID